MTDLEAAQSDTETDSTEEEIEPKFKYRRIGNDLTEILNKDVVTCSAINDKFLIFGTFLGRVYLLDHDGNAASNLQGNSAEISHTVAVNHIDVDARTEYMATCSDDGKVNIIGLFSDENNQQIAYSKSIRAVALDPDPKYPAGKRFIVGDDKLTLYEKNFLKKLKSTVLSTAEGNVLAVCWNGPFVAWASYLGVRVYDLNEKCSLGLMKWEEPSNARLENFRCNFRWANATTLLIGWVDTIRICVIRKRNAIEASTRDLPGFIVDPISTFQTSFYICGLAPFTNNQLVVLGYSKQKDEQHKALRPVLSVVEDKMNSCVELCTDSLSIRGYQEYSVNDYSLGCIVEENHYFIIAPKDIVVATILDTDERLEWLISHKKYEEAMTEIANHGGSVPLLDVARLYITDLLAQEQYDAAAKLCMRVLGNNKDLWVEAVLKFCARKQLRAISPFLPTAENSKLEPYVYEMVLFEYLKQYNDALGFLNLIKEWPPYLYNCVAVIKMINHNYRKEHANELLESLAILYLHQQDYEKALRTYLKLRNKDVFKLIDHYKLYDAIHNELIPLIELDNEKAFKILLDKTKINPEIVVQKLEKTQEHFLYLYLDALDRQDSRGTFDEKLVNLYAKFNREKLLPFLRRSKHYDIQKALTKFERLLFYPEMVYLLGQMGNTTEALNIIINKIKDTDMAIEFCKEHNDLDLWNVLINEAIDKPPMLIKLLDGIAHYVNPVEVLNKIKADQHIPGLRKALKKLLWDYHLQVEIMESGNEIQLQDYFDLHANVFQRQVTAISVTYETVCEKCRLPLMKRDIIPFKDIVAFNCGHTYHGACVPGKNYYEYCDECREQPLDEPLEQ